jgi:subtilisin family serine protease
MILRRSLALAALSALVLSAGALGAPAEADAVRSAQWYLSALGVQKAWTLTRGAGVKVAVIDSGVDGSIPDLRGAVVAGKDFSGEGSANGQTPVYSTSGKEHGTNVASVLAGRGTAGDSGVIGTAPQASLLSASIDVTQPPAKAIASLAAAIHWAVDSGARVINLSLAALSNSDIEAPVRYAQSKDVVVVAATGEKSVAGFRVGLTAPASLPGVVAVTGVDANLRSDPDATIGRGTALAGPYATTAGGRGAGLPVANPGSSLRGKYSTAKGTSLSAPIVAGIAALVRAKYPELDAANVINRLVKTATPVGGTVPNETYGYGIVNADKAVAATVPPVGANPLGSLVPAGAGSSGAPAGSAGATGAASSSPATVSGQTSTSSGLGTGAWIAIAAVVLLAAALVGVLVARGRRTPSRLV